MPDIPTSYSGYVVQLSVSINGQPISNAGNIISITVVQETGKVGYAEVVLLDGDPASGAFTVSSSNDFEPGNKIQIAAGYSNDTVEIFNGTISGQTLNAGEGGFPQLTIIATSAVDRSSTTDTSNPAVLSARYGASLLNFNATQSKQGTKSVIAGELRIVGSPNLKPGEIIQIKGVGERFSGNAVITGVKHIIAGGNWVATVQFKSSYK